MKLGKFSLIVALALSTGVCNLIPDVGQAYWLQADPSMSDLGPVKKASL